MRLNYFIKVALSIFITFFSSYVVAEGYESTDNITATIKNFITQSAQLSEGETINIDVKRLGAFSRLPMCSTELKAELPRNMNKNEITSIALNCEGTQSWHVVIPVDVQIAMNVLVAKHTIPAKSILREDDLELMALSRNLLFNGYYTSKETIKGYEASRLIMPGTVLNEKNLQKPNLISRNQVIDIIVKKNSMVITMKGVSKSDGKLNEAIKAYNPSSKRTIDVVVIGQNKAEAV
jgi:flagella basal body P-ring formation protein FlgA